MGKISEIFPWKSPARVIKRFRRENPGRGVQNFTWAMFVDVENLENHRVLLSSPGDERKGKTTPPKCGGRAEKRPGKVFPGGAENFCTSSPRRNELA